MAKDLAREVGYIYVDTGAMYRAVTLFALRQGLFSPDGGIDAARLETLMPEVTVSFRLDEATGLPLVCLNGECVERDIRGFGPCQSGGCVTLRARGSYAPATGHGA